MSSLMVDILFLRYEIHNKPEWERRVITLAYTHTRHVKNTRAVCHTPKILYGAFTICHDFFIFYTRH